MDLKLRDWQRSDYDARKRGFKYVVERRDGEVLEFVTIGIWCEAHLGTPGERWTTTPGRVRQNNDQTVDSFTNWRFKNLADATLFKLRWC